MAVCNLSKDKIKEGIIEAASNMANMTQLFNIDKDILFSKNESNSFELPSMEVMREIAEAMKFSNEVAENYKKVFTNTPVEFLKDIAYKMNSTLDENMKALSIAGSELSDLAIKLFPDEGKKIKEQEAIDKINSDFKTELIRKISPDSWRIIPNNDIVIRYLATQEGSGKLLLEDMRTHYLSQYSSTSLNLLADDLWKKNPALQDVTTQHLIKFMLKINPNAKIAEVENLDKKAVALIRDYIILIETGSIIDELPHEVAHFFVELLPEDHPLLQEMRKNILDLPIWSKVWSEYKNNLAYQKDGRPNVDKIKKEAIAQQIGEYIQAAYNDKADEQFGVKRPLWRQLIHNFFKFLRRMFVTKSSSSYTEPLTDLSSPFRKASQDILTGNISKLNITKIPTVYDSVFFSTTEDAIPEGYEASVIAKRLHKVTITLKNQIYKVFKKYIKDNKLKGVKELLDEKDADYNRLWDIYVQLDGASTVLFDEFNKENENDINLLYATSRLAEAYKELEMIPDTIKEVLNKMVKGNTEKEIIDNINEVQAYFGFTKSFQLIVKEFESLVAYVGTNYNNKDEAIKIVNLMLEVMGTAGTKMKLLDDFMLKELTKHVTTIMEEWVGGYLSKHRKELEELFGKLTDKDLKKKVLNRLYGEFSSMEQIVQVLTGDLPKSKFLTLDSGEKIDVQKLKDMSLTDNFILLTSSSTLMSDPFISHIMRYYNDKYLEFQLRGSREAKVVADSVSTMIKELENSGSNFYDINKSLFSVQPFYDSLLDEKKIDKKVFLSSTKRHQFNYDKQLKLVKLEELRKELDEVRETKDDEKIKIKYKEVEEAQDAYQKWIRENSYERYTPLYHAKQELIKPRPEDSSTLKSIKQINKRLVVLEQQQFTAIMVDPYESDKEFSIFEHEKYNEILFEIAQLQEDKLLLSQTLPKIEEGTYKLMEELFEEDTINTERLRIKHKKDWVNSIVRQLIIKGTVGVDQTELKKQIEARYDGLYNIAVPTQAFYDRRKEIWDELSTFLGSKIEFKAIQDRLDELNKTQKKITAAFKDSRREVNLSSLRLDSQYKDDKGQTLMYSEILKNIEVEMDTLRKKIKLYSNKFNTTISSSDRERGLTFIDTLISLSAIATNTSSYTPEKVKSLLSEHFDISLKDAEEYLSGIKDSINGDDTNLSNFSYSKFKPKTTFAAETLENIPKSAIEIIKLEELNLEAISQVKNAGNDELDQIKIDDLFQQLNEIYSNGTTLQYNLAMQPFYTYLKEYLNSPLALPEHKKKFFEMEMFEKVEDIENFLGDDLFERVLGYASNVKVTEVSPVDAIEIQKQVDFYLSIHKEKTVRLGEGEYKKVWTLVNSAKRIISHPKYTKIVPPKFLTKSKVREVTENGERLLTEKIFENDPEVLAGNKQATVDINGKWLPLEIEGNEYWDEEYATLKEGKTEKDRTTFKLLESLKKQYLDRQVEGLEEGERLSTVVPAMGVDKYEQKKMKTKDIWEWIKNIRPWAKTHDTEEEQNILEDILAITPKNRDIYTGLIINEEKAKLRSLRRIPIERTTDDVISSVLMFFEDINEYTAKNITAPLFKSFADVFDNTHKLAPHTNKVRANTLQKLYEVKILDQVPESWVNNPTVTKLASILNQIASFRLLGDPLGALVNLTSGELQMLIEVNFDKEAAKRFLSVAPKAAQWLISLDKDFYDKSNWGLQTQLINAFNMIPDQLEISKQMSRRALLASFRKKLMAPRSETEKLMGIQTGLMVLSGESIMFNGKKIKVEDLYELDKITNLLELKPIYKSLEEDWNIFDGKKVVTLRRSIMQFYTLQQGNYYKQNKAYGSYFSIGRMILLMKQWLPAGIIRRFQARVYDPYTEKERVGYHTAMLSLMGNTLIPLITGNPTKATEYWENIAKRPSEMQAIRKSAAELLYLVIFGLLVSLAFGYDDDDEDKNKKLKEMSYLKQLALLISLRAQSELGTYIPLPIFGLGYMEMQRAVLNPIGLPKLGADNLMNLGKLTLLQTLSVFGADFDKELFYQKEKGYGYNIGGLGAFKDKGDSKWFAALLNTIGYTGYTFEPAEYIKTFTQMQNRVK